MTHNIKWILMNMQNPVMIPCSHHLVFCVAEFLSSLPHTFHYDCPEQVYFHKIPDEVVDSLVSQKNTVVSSNLACCAVVLPGFPKKKKMECKFWNMLHSSDHLISQWNVSLVYVSDWGGQCLLRSWWTPSGAPADFTTRGIYCELHPDMFWF